jgi:uncharacterized protein with von Willebrand factor type A (vWA) domain
MLINFFDHLRARKVPVSVRELLDLHEALKSGLVYADQSAFYSLARTVMVKDEKHYDRFDQAFADFMKGVDASSVRLLDANIPDDWLRNALMREFTDEEKAAMEAMGDLDKLMQAFRKRLEEQKKRHQGGNRWIGTGGASPFGAHGFNPEGIRIGQSGGRHQRAVKVWEQRQFRNLDENVELGTRNIKLALRRLRRFARQGAAELLDLDNTIQGTAAQGGILDIHMMPERHNAVKVLLFLDIGGSMDPHVRLCEELFSACKTEFKHLEYFYFHNFIYESVWKNNLRRSSERTSTWDLMHKYGADYRVIFVGDASMAPYEISHVGGSVEHFNEEPGSLWMNRVTDTWKKVIWLNPMPEQAWTYTYSTQMTRELMDDRMFPLTLKGIEDGIRALAQG